MTRTPIRRLSAGLALALVGTLALAACGSSDGGGEGDGDVGVSLIIKTTSNPFFVAMQDGAKKAAKEDGVDLTLAAGKSDGDEATQIQAIENAISQGQKGILITPNGPGVVDAIEKARDAGPVRDRARHPARPAGRRRHHLRHRQLRGRRVDRLSGPPRSSTARRPPSRCSTCSTTRSSRSTTTATRASSTGMGIDTKDAKKNGDEAETGSYSGGDYKIACNEATNGAEDGGTNRDGELPVQEPRHQRRLHDQRARRRTARTRR